MRKWLIALCLIGMLSGCSTPNEDTKPKEEPKPLEETETPEEPTVEEEAEIPEDTDSEEESETSDETESTDVTKPSEPEEESTPVVETPTPTPTPVPTPTPEPTPEPEPEQIPTEIPDPAYVRPVIKSRYYNMGLSQEENVSLALQHAGITSAIVVKAVEEPNIVVVVKAMSPLQSISIHDINMDRYATAGYDIFTYLEGGQEAPIPNTGVYSLNPNEAIAFLCFEPDTMPWHYISWYTASGGKGGHVVQFDGKNPLE